MTSKFLTPDELVKRAPSVGTRMAHPSVSSRYVHINTLQIAEMLMEQGWGAVSAREQFLKGDSNAGFQQHEVRFRQSNRVSNHKWRSLPSDHRIEMDNAEEIFELIIKNSHNRSSAWELMSGIFVQVCANGLVISKQSFSEIRIPHINITRGEILANVSIAAERMGDIMLTKDEMKQVDLTEGQRLDFAERALLLRYETKAAAPVRPSVLLEARRKEDADTNLWKTYQVVQENLIRGLQRDEGKRDQFGRGYGPSAPITSINRSSEVNQGLWDLSLEYMNN